MHEEGNKKKSGKGNLIKYFCNASQCQCLAKKKKSSRIIKVVRFVIKKQFA